MYSIRELKNTFENEPFLEERGASFTQSGIYAGWQVGKEVRRFVIEKDGEIQASFQAIKYPLLLGKSYYYLPYGPVIKESSEELLNFIKENVSVLKEKDVVYVRLDFFPIVSNSNIFFKVPKKLSTGSNFQPRQEWVLDIKKEAEILLADMHKNTRYSIRTAEKRGIRVEIIRENFMKYFADFYRLMAETAERNHFSLHSESYYKNIFMNLDKENKGQGYLSVAFLDKQILVIDLIIIYGKTANYVFSGSSSEQRNLMPTYLAQWQSILEAKAWNCEEYNFGGIKMNGEKEKKDWAGLTDYKMKFGGRLVEHSDFYDIIYQPFWYAMYSLRKLFK